MFWLFLISEVLVSLGAAPNFQPQILPPFQWFWVRESVGSLNFLLNLQQIVEISLSVCVKYGFSTISKYDEISGRHLMI